MQQYWRSYGYYSVTTITFYSSRSSTVSIGLFSLTVDEHVVDGMVVVGGLCPWMWGALVSLMCWLRSLVSLDTRDCLRGKIYKQYNETMYK